MDIQELRYFVTVADLGNYSAAASYLFVSRQAVTKGIKKIECEIGRSLFEADGKQLVLTTEGAALLADARPIVDRFMELCRTHLSRTPLPGNRFRETLHIDVVGGWDHGLSENPINIFQQTYAGASPYIKVDNATSITRSVSAKHTDVGMLLTHPTLIEEFDSVLLYHMLFYVWMRDDHPLAHHVKISPVDLHGQSFITLSNANHVSTFIFGECRRQGYTPISSGEAGSVEMLRKIAINSDKLHFDVSPTHIQDVPSNMKAIPLAIPGIEDFGLYAIRKRSAAYPPALRHFWNILQNISSGHSTEIY